MVDGCFDPLHDGHIAYFKAASAFALPILCNVENDCYLENVKHRPSLLADKKRIILIDSIKYISYTHLQTSTTDDVLLKLKPLIYFKGADWTKKKLPQEEIDICRKYNIKIAYMDKNINSSSQVVADFLKKYR